MEAEAIVAITGSTVTVLGTIGAGVKWLFSKLVDFVEKREADCEKKIEALSARLDDCQEKHIASSDLMAEFAERMGDRRLASRARSISPPRPMRAVHDDAPSLERPSGEHETWDAPLDLPRRPATLDDGDG